MKDYIKRISKHLRVLIVVAAVVLTSALFYGFTDNFFEITKNLDIFATLFKELNLYYVDETKPGDLMKKGIDAMLESLDPYTNYIPESEIEDYRFMTTGQYGGIGAQIRTKDSMIVIAEPYEGFAAQKAGLIAGDVILEVNGKSTKGKSTNDVSKILKGQPNTTVKLLIRRDGEKKPFEKVVTREEIKVKAVPYYGMINDKIGYINLTQFTENCTDEVREAFQALKNDNKMEALVLDLRSNPGGLLKEAVNLSNLFVDKGQLIVNTKGKVKEWSSSYKAQNPPLDTEIPIVVLVNSSSASASEIVSGTLQDLDRAAIVGQKSYGKGLVQTTRPLSYNAQLKVTTAKYYIPSGRCIQALDYSNRNEDGSVGKIPDSLISKFETVKKKRIVYDGGGITPDYAVEPRTLSPISKSLYDKMLIFDFATGYHQQHPALQSAREFVVTDELYNEFISFISNKEYDYTTSSEDLVEKFKSTAEKEKYFQAVKPEYEALKAKLMHNKNDDLAKFKDEIKELLKSEISSRYYYQKGRIEASMNTDPELKQALKVLGDKQIYASTFEKREVEKK